MPSEKDLCLDSRGDGMYSGTFRWTTSKTFPKLPLVNDTLSVLQKPYGWRTYLTNRGGGMQLVDVAKKDPSFLDALSFPITICHIIDLLRNTALKDHGPLLNIVVLGATIKAEQRIWHSTSYWDEISTLFPEYKEINLFLTGPEVDESSPLNKKKSSVNVRILKGTATDILTSHKWDPLCTILVGYNTGFGNFIESQDFRLFWSWLPDLKLILDSSYLTLFCCANDYADLNGEFAIHSRVLGSNFIVLPKENPFSAASHLHEDGKKETSWSRANSFYYVVKGYSSGKKKNNVIKSEDDIKRLLQTEKDVYAVDALGRALVDGVIVSSEQQRAPITVGKIDTSSRTHIEIHIDNLPYDIQMKDMTLDVSNTVLKLGIVSNPDVKVCLPSAVEPNYTTAKLLRTQRKLLINLKKKN